MDLGAGAKRTRRRRKNNTDITPQQEKELVYFSNDTILEAVKFLNYEKWSKMRFLCRRVNQLIHSNQLKLQAFEVKRLSMSEEIAFRKNSIVSFDRGIQPADAVKKWFQDCGYSCDETIDMPLEKVFACTNLYGDNGLHFTFRAFFERPGEKNMRLAKGQAKRMGKARKKSHRLKPPELFSAEFNAKYEFYGPILSHFFRLLHHPAAYFREVSMFPPMTDKFCDEASHSPIRCDQFTLQAFDSSLEHSFKWLKDNVCAQHIILSFNIGVVIPISDLYSHVSEFLLLDASICARDSVKLDWLRHPKEFVNTLIKKYETLEVTKAIPLIVIEECAPKSEFFESSLVAQDDPLLVDKRCDSCDIKTYELPIKSDGSRKMIAQVRRCFERECLYGDSMIYMRFE